MAGRTAETRYNPAIAAPPGNIFMYLSSPTRRWFVLPVLLLAPLPAPAQAPDRDAYLRGYVDALLDSRFSGLGLRALAVEGERVTLGARTCLGPSQKRDIARLLEQTGRVGAVAWDDSTDCDKPAPAAGRERADGAAAADPDAVAGTAVEAPAASRVEIRPLPERELFAPLIADPRQPRFSMSYQYYRTPRDRFNAASVAFGEYFGLAQGSFGARGTSQVGIQGAVFALFNLDAASSDLVNADYWIGLPWSFRRGPWSYQVKLYHQSSHLGDEFLLGNPGVNRVNLSYEEIKGLASYEWEQWRVYGGGGYILHSEPDLQRKHVQGGVEYLRPRAWRALDFIAAVDAQSSEELGWKSSLSYQAGFEFRGASQHRVRLMLEHFDGHSPNGQFYRERLRYTGLGLYFRF